MDQTPAPIPEPQESFDRYSIRAQRALFRAVPDAFERLGLIRQTWNDHRGPTPEEQLADRTFAPDRYRKVRDVCVFSEHDTTDSQGKPRKYRLRELAKLVRYNNERALEKQAFAAIADRHTTNPGDPNPSEPRVIGYAGPYRLGLIGSRKPTWAIFADEYRFPDEDRTFRDKNRRSVELWTDKARGLMWFDPITTCGAEAPRLALPAQYSQVTNQGVTLERYTAGAFGMPGVGSTYVPGFRAKNDLVTGTAIPSEPKMQTHDSYAYGHDPKNPVQPPTYPPLDVGNITQAMAGRDSLDFGELERMPQPYVDPSNHLQLRYPMPSAPLRRETVRRGNAGPPIPPPKTKYAADETTPTPKTDDDWDQWAKRHEQQDMAEQGGWAPDGSQGPYDPPVKPGKTQYAADEAAPTTPGGEPMETLSPEALKQIVDAILDTPQMQWVSDQMQTRAPGPDAGMPPASSAPPSPPPGAEPVPGGPPGAMPAGEPDGDELGDLDDLLGGDDEPTGGPAGGPPVPEEPEEKNTMAPYTQQGLPERYAALQASQDRLVREHGRALEVNKQLAGRLTALEHRAKDAERMATIERFTADHAQFPFDREKLISKALYSKGGQMSDEQFAEKLEELTQYAQAFVPTMTLPGGEAEKGQTDRERYEQRLGREAIRIHTSARDRGVEMTWDEAKAEAAKAVK